MLQSDMSEVMYLIKVINFIIFLAKVLELSSQRLISE